MTRTFRIKPFAWAVTELFYSKELFLEVTGRDENNRKVHLRICGFEPHVFVVLPKSTKFTDNKIRKIFNFLCDSMPGMAPVSYTVENRKNLYYLQPELVMRINLSVNSACYLIAKILSKNICISGVGSFPPGSFSVHEHTISPLIKFATQYKIKLADWIECKELECDENDDENNDEDKKFTYCDVDANVDVHSVKQISSSKFIYPKYASFDIECTSCNHNSRMPNPALKYNVVFQIAFVVGYISKQIEKKYLLTLFDPHDIPDVEVIRCKSEKKLLLKFVELIQTENIDIFIGFNIMKFDWRYLVARADLCGITKQFEKLSVVIGESSPIKTQEWASSAYKKQVMVYPECVGRIHLDVLIEVERNYKLNKYTLNSVADKFDLGQKDDVSARQLFMIYDATYELLNFEGSLKEHKSTLSKLWTEDKTTGVVLNLKEKLLKSKTIDDFKYILRDGITITGKYCIQDTILPILILDKINMWYGMQAMSNCTGIPLDWIHTRGQQIRVLSQVYNLAYHDGLFIPHRERNNSQSDTKYEGATVFEANIGDYNNVATNDFASLYPSMMITYNICFSTLMKDDASSNDDVSDDLCNVLEWDQHTGCEHDTRIHNPKIKTKDIVCHHHKYRFRKIQFSPNGDKIHEGIMPRLERNLLAERKGFKNELAKVSARIKMHKGSASEDDISYYKKCNYDIISKGSLDNDEFKELEIKEKVLDATQLAVKVACNSAYGALGARGGFLELIPAAASITAMGRKTIGNTCKFLTERFGAKLVYGDTDSCMMTYPTNDLKETFMIAKKGAKAASHYLKCLLMEIPENYSINSKRLDEVKLPDLEHASVEEKLVYYRYNYIQISLEFENLYGRYILLSKKRYIAYPVNEDNKVLKRTEKGIVLARRDNSAYVRYVYDKIVDAILKSKSVDDVVYLLCCCIHELFQKKFTIDYFVIYKGLSDILDFAKSADVMVKGVKKTMFIDASGNPFDDVTGQNDPRLVFKCESTNSKTLKVTVKDPPSHAMLALKMIQRGDEIATNTKMEYVFLDYPEHKGMKQHEKIEDLTYYCENAYKLPPIDYLYYIEKQVLKPVTELLEVKLPKQEVVYYDNIMSAISRELFKLPHDKRVELAGGKDLIKKIVYDKSLRNEYIYTLASIEYSKNILKRLGANPGIYAHKPKSAFKIYRPKARVHIFSKEINGTIISVDKDTCVYTIQVDDGSRGDFSFDQVGLVYYKDTKIINDLLLYHKYYKCVVKQIKLLYSCVVML